METESPPELNRADNLGTDVAAKPVTWERSLAAQYATILLRFCEPDARRSEAYKAQAMVLIEQLAPGDAVEQMLVSQLVLLHARVQFLSRLAAGQKLPVWSNLYSSQLERAVGGFQKLLATFLDQRRPRRRRRGSFTTIRTAHITARQLIGLQPPFPHAQIPQVQIDETDPQTTERASPEIDPPESTVEARDGPKIVSWQEDREPERR